MPTPALPPLALSKSLPRGPLVLVVGLGATGVRAVPAAVDKAYTKRFGSDVATLAAAVGATAKAGHTRTLPGVDDVRVVVVGLGGDETTAVDGPALRDAAAAGVRQAGGLAEEKEKVSVAVALGASTVEEALAVASGALLGTYAYGGVSSGPATGPKIDKITVVHEGSTRTADGDDVATSPRSSRPRSPRPASGSTSRPTCSTRSRSPRRRRRWPRAAGSPARCWTRPRSAAQGYGGLMAVGGGSARPPRLVRLTYRPRGAKTHLALVGKGITFDTGGLNLKSADGMYTMKCDMAGAAAVLAATWAIAKLGLKIKVTAYAAMAENMPSGSAYRPSDVLTIFGGKTVENGNSDAEGRLVMADAFARSNADAPDLVVDVATLTGAAVVALGDRTAGVMATDDPTARRVLDAARLAGEPFWQLPIPAETRAKLDSTVADLRSTGPDRAGGALVAAAFLREFVDAPTPWAHLDIAGPAFRTGRPRVRSAPVARASA